jgi:L-seryl-tRNA(Ser) seleniumtransferase
LEGTIYERLGTRPAINARGIYSSLGGSAMSSRVRAAMTEADGSFVLMAHLLRTCGRRIADLVGADAAWVTTGAAAGIAVGTAVCMTGRDGRKMEQLPDTTGMPSDVLIQSRHRNKYDRLVRMSGARLVEVGNGNGSTEQQLAAAISPSTAAIFVPAHLDGIEGTVPLARVTAIAREHQVPTLVDAAFKNYPIRLMRDLCTSGADLVIFSAKYLGGPNAGGFICGRRDLIEGIAASDFTGFESGAHRTFGRPFKLDRGTIVGVVAALEEWIEMDHAARFASYKRLVEQIGSHLKDIPGVRTTPMCFTMDETLEPEPINCLHVAVDATSGTSARDVDAAMREGKPSILGHLLGDVLIFDVECVSAAEADVIGHRLREEFLRPQAVSGAIRSGAQSSH